MLVLVLGLGLGVGLATPRVPTLTLTLTQTLTQAHRGGVGGEGGDELARSRRGRLRRVGPPTVRVHATAAVGGGDRVHRRTVDGRVALERAHHREPEWR